MSDVVIKVENVGKQYHLGKVGTGTIANDLNRWWHIARGKEDPYLKIGSVNDRTSKSSINDIVWAVKDISFEVKQGEVLGIIGKNGAGKSTLLKILSRVTAPTTGDIKVKGRIASLLEVGTGFHPDLSGRENIFLNGAILGMTKQEIKLKFDEIVDFSGVERYIDTPVKRYSSGMYVRLAFAVAAHLEPEILIVDEVLAVGDAEFQKKCLGKMKDVSGEGRTVLFVSHNMEAVSTLTGRSIVLDNGRLHFNGKTASAITEYFNIDKSRDIVFKNVVENSYIRKIYLNTSLPSNIQKNGDEFIVNIEIDLKHPLKNGGIAIQVFNELNKPIIHTWHFDNEKCSLLNFTGIKELKCSLKRLRLYKGNYNISVFLAENYGSTILETINNVCPFAVEMIDSYREFKWQEGACVYMEEFQWV